MSVTVFPCPTCVRDVHLSSDASPYCPVCSTPLVEAPAHDDFTLITETVEAGPELYLG